MNTNDMQLRVERFAAGKRPKPKPEWHMPTLDDLAWGVHVQAFDQTLTNTALVDFVAWQTGIEIIRKVMVRPKPGPDLVSFELSYEKAALLEDELLDLVYSSSDVIYEMPAVQGKRTESSFLAGYVIYNLTRRHRPGKPAKMVSKQHVGSVLCNNGNATKADVRKALVELLPEVDTREWNEHTRDALAVGLTHLYDRKKAFSEH